jgi:hypothetical protein
LELAKVPTLNLISRFHIGIIQRSAAQTNPDLKTGLQAGLLFKLKPIFNVSIKSLDTPLDTFYISAGDGIGRELD